MRTMQASGVMRSSLAVVLAVVLVGCTPLTDEVSDPSTPAPNLTQSEVAASPTADPKLQTLEPETGEVLRVALSNDSSLHGTKIRLEDADTFVSWTCVGTGQLRYVLGNESGGGDCQDVGHASVQRNEGTTTKTQNVELRVQVQPGQEWSLLVTQASKN